MTQTCDVVELFGNGETRVRGFLGRRSTHSHGKDQPSNTRARLLIPQPDMPRVCSVHMDGWMMIRRRSTKNMMCLSDILP